MENGLILRWLSPIVALLTCLVSVSVALTPDGLALLEFKNGLTTTSPLLEGWSASDLSPCAWGGITCTANGEVQNISLPNQVPKLEGNISASLGQLESLEVLWLDGNFLSGSIPPELGNLVNLMVLSLSRQNLSGEIPPQLSNCRSLVQLRLDWNHFMGDITTVLGDLLTLPAIEQIGLDGNGFTGTLPPSIRNATTLVYLSIGSEGQRTGGFGGQIPAELGNLVNLSTLYLGGNSFIGVIPPEIENMTLLNQLDLSENNLTGIIPPSLGYLVNLDSIQLHTNNLSGSIPESFTSLTQLTVLHLGWNDLTGPIPINMSNTATSLEEIRLLNNMMSEPIPEDFGRFMPNLTFFDIEYNLFVGRLPDGLCQGGKLKSLFVSGNELEGAIPSSLAHCPSLVEARLSDNQFTSLPDGFGSNLQYLYASRNKLTGPLPMALGTNQNLTVLDLSENMLIGNISQLARSLQILNLAKNNFTGQIPASVGICNSLFQLDLSYNCFTGTIPLALGNLSKLQELHLQGNNLTALNGIVFAETGSLYTLNLAENPWNAPIDPSLGELTILQTLNLSFGRFTGAIPPALGKLTQLEVLDLSHNDLTGEIPSVLGGAMTSLISVNVSFNSLTGPLPPEWVKFLIASPDSFTGNPGLCVLYNENNICVEGSGGNNTAIPGGNSTGGKISLRVGILVGVVFGVTLAFVIFTTFLICWCPTARIRDRHSKRAPGLNRSIIKNLTPEPLPFKFGDVMAATDNLSEAHVIGRGYHGAVYKATLANGRDIVVKKIEALDMKTALVHKSFWKEIESLGNARHPNVVRLLGFMQWAEVGFLLYDYVSNRDLRAALHDRERAVVLDWKARLRIAKGVANGLTYLHHTCNPPVVHRDITSSNVLLDDNMEAQISDFGLSKVLDSTEPRSQQWSSTTPAVLGTYGYIAPEVGYSTVVTTKLDVYSYGVLLLELLTGRQPADDPIFGESLHVVAWVKDQVRQTEGRMSESVLDPALLDEKTPGSVKEEMLSVQRIALLCAKENPTERPAMKHVVGMFTSLELRRT